MAELTTAIPQLSQLPQCILPAYEAIAAAGCGPNLACICGNENFFLTLEGVLLMGACPPVEAEEAFLLTQSICAKAVPWLKHNRGPEIVSAITIMTVLATITFVLRVIARKIAKLNFGVDDWLITLALLFSYGITIDQYIAVHYGQGKHILMLQSENIIPFTKAYFICTIMFVVCAGAVKLSVLFFYLRIFPDRRFRIVSIVIVAITVAWAIAYLFLIFFLCQPFAYWWNKTIPGGHCLNATHVAFYGTSPPDILTNIAILILPIPYLWKLQMAQWKKWSVTIIFALGSFATIGSIVRVPLIAELKATDVTYSIVNSAIWLNVECNMGILSASLPMLRPLFNKKMTSALRSRFRGSDSTRYGSGSQRIPDVEKSGNTRSSTLVGSNDGGSGNGSVEGGAGNIYQGGGVVGKGGHKTWYNSAVSAMATRNDDRSSECSQEGMVPMGKIGVRSQVDWKDNKDDHAGAETPPHAA